MHSLRNRVTFVVCGVPGPGCLLAPDLNLHVFELDPYQQEIDLANHHILVTDA